MSETAPLWPARDPGVFVDELFTWFARVGSSCFDEELTQLEHGLQTAYLAERAGAGDAEIVAGLLHDVGHLLLEEHLRQPEFLDEDLEHERVGADWLARMFPPEVWEPVAQHVQAKRYLCSMEGAYGGRLSEASRRSLELQGGALSPDDCEAVSTRPHFQAAVRLRRRDEGAKAVGREVPQLEHYREHLMRLLQV